MTPEIEMREVIEASKGPSSSVIPNVASVTILSWEFVRRRWDKKMEPRAIVPCATVHSPAPGAPKVWLVQSSRMQLIEGQVLS